MPSPNPIYRDFFDRRPEAPPITERTSFGSADTPSGRKVVVLRA